jgi:hypothetical protein
MRTDNAAADHDNTGGLDARHATDQQPSPARIPL